MRAEEATPPPLFSWSYDDDDGPQTAGRSRITSRPRRLRRGGAPTGILQVIPAPASVEPAAGGFEIANGMAIVALDARAEPVARYLADLLDRTRGIRLRQSTTGDATNGIRLSLDSSTPGSLEAYARVVRRAASRSAPRTRVAFSTGPSRYGSSQPRTAPRPAQRRSRRCGSPTVRASPGAGSCSTPRGIPVAGFRPEALIDAMARTSSTSCTGTLVDDQGWRLEIQQYPGLTSVGAWRSPATAPGDPRCPAPAASTPRPRCATLVAYAAPAYVTIVPEIEMPGHAQAAIRAYPATRHGRTAAPGSRPTGACTPWLFNADDETLLLPGGRPGRSDGALPRAHSSTSAATRR